MNALPLPISAQPDARSCGPTCLHAVYGFHGLRVSLPSLVEEIDQLETGGTLAVQLGIHALDSGFDATIYTYNLSLFDPTWFHGPDVALAAKLEGQAKAKPDARLSAVTSRYLTFLERGGVIRHAPLSANLLAGLLEQGLPILTGLSSTYLYDAMREVATDDTADDVRGTPVGHFVVIHGLDLVRGRVRVADPWPGETGKAGSGDHDLWRVLTSIALGVLTYDANLLVLRPKS